MTERIWIGRLPIDKVDLAGALASIEQLIATGAGGMVFTPNVDHVVIGDENPRFRRAYARVSLSLVDGTPLLWASHLLRDPLPAKVSGSDLVLPLMQRAAERGWRVFLLGGAPGVAEKAAARLGGPVPGDPRRRHRRAAHRPGWRRERTGRHRRPRWRPANLTWSWSPLARPNRKSSATRSCTC